ncbi:MAG: hypothetical protein ACI8UO_005213 [Verrucomicrobiales bacterium]|jgi:hypothetical protein
MTDTTSNDTADRVKDTARAAKRRALSAVKELKSAGREAVRNRQRMAANRVAEYETIASDAAAILRKKQCPALAERAETVANLTADARNYLAGSEPEEVWRDTEDCIRKHPSAAFSCFFVAGLAVGRFLKSSSRRGSNRGAFTSIS